MEDLPEKFLNLSKNLHAKLFNFSMSYLQSLKIYHNIPIKFLINF